MAPDRRPVGSHFVVDSQGFADEEDQPDGEVGEVRMLYPSLALFSHSCSPNTQVEKKTGSKHKKIHILSMPEKVFPSF